MVVCKVCQETTDDFRKGRTTCRTCENHNRSLNRSQNWDRELEYKREWKKRNPDLVRIYNKRDTANKRCVDKISVDDVKYILDRDNNACRSCSSTTLIELDHVQAIDNGGLNVRDNLQILCRYHNRQKSNKELDIDTGGW